MARKDYKNLIGANLAKHAMAAKEYTKKDRKEISNWDDSAIADFFRMMVDTVEEDMKSGVRKGSVARAFIESDLPPGDPFNWSYVLQAFTDVHYHNKRGGKVEYDGKYRDVLWQRLRPIVMKQRSRNLLAACRQLVKQYPLEYGAVTAEDATFSKDKRERKAEFSAKTMRTRIKDFHWWPESFDKAERPQ